jgi:hypothetical protein
LAQVASHIAAAIDEDAQRCESVRRVTKQSSFKPKKESEFAGKVAHITGGTSGIGAATPEKIPIGDTKIETIASSSLRTLA